MPNGSLDLPRRKRACTVCCCLRGQRHRLTFLVDVQRGGDLDARDAVLKRAALPCPVHLGPDQRHKLAVMAYPVLPHSGCDAVDVGSRLHAGRDQAACRGRSGHRRIHRRPPAELTLQHRQRRLISPSQPVLLGRCKLPFRIVTNDASGLIAGLPRLHLPCIQVAHVVAALTGLLLPPGGASTALEHAGQFHRVHRVPIEPLRLHVVAGGRLPVPGPLAEYLAHGIRDRGQLGRFGPLVQHDVDPEGAQVGGQVSLIVGADLMHPVVHRQHVHAADGAILADYDVGRGHVGMQLHVTGNLGIADGLDQRRT